MAKVHDKYVIELAEVIKGYGNNPDVADPFRLSEFYRIYELPNIAVSQENFDRMQPLDSVQPTQSDTSNTLKALDCVERQAAIDAVKRNTFRLTFAEEQNCEGHVAWSAEAVYSDVIEGELLELPPAQPENCEGCKHIGKWENEVEYGYPSPCTRCKRRVEDHYER